ncbi:hypothetical protein [Gilvibacter sp.]
MKRVLVLMIAVLSMNVGFAQNGGMTEVGGRDASKHYESWRF